MTWVLDLDGVVWRGNTVIEGAPEAIARLQSLGTRVVYATNNATLTSADYVGKLGGFGIEAKTEDIVHGGHALARLVEPGQKVLVCAGIGVREALHEAGVEAAMAEDVEGLEPPTVDAVAVGWGAPDQEYRRLTLAVRAVLAGARLLAPSPDPLYPTSEGVLIGGGALATAVAYATRTTVAFAGKPEPAMVAAVMQRVTDAELMVGDQLATDGALALALQVPFAWVQTGISTTTQPDGAIPVATQAADLAEVVDSYLSARKS